MVLHVPILYTENTPCPGLLRLSRDANDIIFIIHFITLWVIKTLSHSYWDYYTLTYHEIITKL